MDLYLDVPIRYSLTGSQMFQIDENSGDVSTTPDFDPDILPQNGLELILKATQVDSGSKSGTSLLKLEYGYNLEPPKWTFTDNNLGAFHEIGVISENEIFASDDQNIADIEYKLHTNPEGRYRLTKNGQYVNLELVQMSDESIIDILTIEATERNVIP